MALTGAVLAAPAAALAASTEEPGQAELTTPTPAPSETPSPLPPSSSPEIPRPGAPSESPSSGTEVQVTVDPIGDRVSLPLTLTGTRTAGAEVQIQIADGSGQPLCISPAADTTWSCSIDSLPSGASVPVRVVALRDGSSAERIVTVAWLSAPTISASDVATTSGHVGGAAYPGATVTASAAESSSSCTTNADDSGVWSCVLGEPLSTGSYTVSATQLMDFYGTSKPSASVAVIIDRDAPGSPAITAPISGATTPLAAVRVAGTGEDGSTVLVFAGIRLFCQSVVTDGRWACDGVPDSDGRLQLSAVQRDAAGNLGVAGVGISINVSPQSPGSSPPNAAPGQSEGSNNGAAGGASVTPPTGESEPSPQTGAPSPTPDSAGPPPAETGWALGLRSPTEFGTVLAPLTGAVGVSLVTAAGLSVGTLGLALLPAIAGFRTLRSRMVRLPRLTGRNRTAVDEAEANPAAPTSPWAVGIAALIGATVIAILSGPVLAQSNYVRLGAAVLVGLVIVNAVGTVAVAAAARRFFKVKARVAVRPGLLGVAALAAAVTRIFSMTPPLAFGQILGIDFDDSATARTRSRVAVARVGALMALAFGGWIAYSALDLTATPELLFANELAATVTFAAAGSAAISLVPVARSAGVELLRRSRRLWASTAFAAWTLLFTILTSTLAAQGASGVVTAAVVAASFGAVGASTWLWVRFVEPALRG